MWLPLNCSKICHFCGYSVSRDDLELLILLSLTLLAFVTSSSFIWCWGSNPALCMLGKHSVFRLTSSAFCWVCLWFSFEIQSLVVYPGWPQTFRKAEYELEFLIRLASNCWNYRHVLPYQGSFVLILKGKLVGSPYCTRIRNLTSFASVAEVPGLYGHAPYLARQALSKMSNVKLTVM